MLFDDFGDDPFKIEVAEIAPGSGKYRFRRERIDDVVENFASDAALAELTRVFFGEVAKALPGRGAPLFAIYCQPSCPLRASGLCSALPDHCTARLKCRRRPNVGGVLRSTPLLRGAQICAGARGGPSRSARASARQDGFQATD